MELNLRKARKLETKIKQFLDQSNLQHQVAVRIKSEVAEAQTKVQAAATKLEADLDLQTKLNELRFAIRNQISVVNHATGINQLMNQREALQAKLQLLNKLATTEVAHGEQELKDLLVNTAHAVEQGIHYVQNLVHVSTSAVTEKVKQSVSDEVNSVKKELETLEDELAQKNLGAKVSLGDKDIDLLKSAGLV